ncbi:flagellar export protein FliJ [Ureibacillus manganicus]|uniref:Flagellar FliJ protein n=1 Tax=Ureibacillus manganicus DSM 26584 TaxID=1384049 RepID=A0A0A3IA76_9BACL|nr:flagellar export protein FliJ [Ureibacillus manganicus]KGR80355.1 flagellar biosynthesis chaperone [Ureibacillus manganicus DSM 26584]
MLQYKYRFEKVLTIREQEKQQTEMAYKESVQAFEEVASKLYELLKKKEDLISFQTEKLKAGSTINEIHHFASFIDSLEKSITDVQQKVMQARTKMNWHEQKLVEKSLEVRKFEKMREKDLERFKEEQNKAEMLMMDELSSIMYSKKEVR